MEIIRINTKNNISKYVVFKESVYVGEYVLASEGALVFDRGIHRVDENYLYLLSIYLKEEFRGKGVASYILKRIQFDCNKYNKNLIAYPLNSRSERLLRKNNVKLYCNFDI